MPRGALLRNARKIPDELQLSGLRIVKGLHGREDGNSLLHRYEIERNTKDHVDAEKLQPFEPVALAVDRHERDGEDRESDREVRGNVGANRRDLLETHRDVERVLYRVTLVGDVPVGVDGLKSELVSGEVFGARPPERLRAAYAKTRVAEEARP